jgi:hypothetical protein
MNLLQPPTLATWLLQHFRSGPRNDSVIGDLMEQYHLGRSRTWYWRQVLMAIVISFSTEIWRHKLLTIRAVVAGWTTLLFLCVMLRFPPPLDKSVWDLLAFVIPGNWWRYRWGYFGWLMLCIVSCGSGLIVARFHRTHQTAMVLAYAVSLWLWYLPGFCRIVTDTLGNSRYASYAVFDLALMILVPFSILLGGLWNASPKCAALAESDVKDGDTEGPA